MGHHEQRHGARSARAPTKMSRTMRVLRAWALAVADLGRLRATLPLSLFGAVAGA
jgi:hypothetical protein